MCWLVGYFVARHVLYPFDEDEVILLSMVWGLIVAELGWLATQWTSAYTIVNSLLMPQMAIVTSLIGYVAMRAYVHYYRETLSWKKMRAPVLFAIAAISVMLVREISALFS